jgi:integrase
MVPTRSPKLTQGIVDHAQLPAGKADHFMWDSDIPGFGLRLRQGGSRGFVFWYRVGSQRRKMNLGAASAMTTAEVRKLASRLHAEVKLGRDPAGERAVTATRAAETVGSVLPRFLTRQQGRLRPRAYVEVERHLKVHAKKLHPQPLAGVTRRDVAATLSGLEADMSGATVNRVRSSLSGFFTWCIKEGLIDSNPASFTDRRVEVSRDRVLADDELRIIWRTLVDNAYGDIVRLLLLTGARREEMGALRWSEVDLAQALIVLPPARTKAKRVHEIPLSDAVVAILQARPRLTLSDGSLCDHVFGRGVRGFADWVGSKVDTDARIGKEIATPWTLHDFRRTLSTTMHERLGVDPHIVEAILGHVGHQRGVAGVYNRAAYRDEKRAALQAWADHVGRIV